MHKNIESDGNSIDADVVEVKGRHQIAFATRAFLGLSEVKKKNPMQLWVSMPC